MLLEIVEIFCFVVALGAAKSFTVFNFAMHSLKMNIFISSSVKVLTATVDFTLDFDVDVNFFDMEVQMFFSVVKFAAVDAIVLFLHFSVTLDGFPDFRLWQQISSRDLV